MAKKRIKKTNINIELPALKILFENFANDSYGLINELIKLSLYEPNKKLL
jgi:DNA polymerase III delta subunit